MSGRIRLLVSDVDGTIVRSDKTLAPSTLAAAARLREAGVALALVSARPPRGMRWIAEALGLATPLAGFNGGMLTEADGTLIENLPIPRDVVRQALDLFARAGVQPWLFSALDWLVLDPAGDYVAHERYTIRFDERVVSRFGPYLDRADKLVGVSADFDHLARVEAELQTLVGDRASVHRSQPYYLDVTHPGANKGAAVRRLADLLGVPLSGVAVIGDMANDVPMFAVAGVSIAMGNAAPAVRSAAGHVTGANDRDGWAQAVGEIVLRAE